MNEPKMQSPDYLGDWQYVATWMLFITWVWATSIEAFIRRDFGRRYFGLNALAVFLLVPFYCLGFDKFDLRPMLWFLYAFFGMLCVSRIRGLLKGPIPCHSFYNGTPMLMGKRSTMDEVTFKRTREPLYVMLLGVALATLSPPLGIYVVIGGFALMARMAVTDQIADVKVMDLNDALIEQQQMADRFRSYQGG